MKRILVMLSVFIFFVITLASEKPKISVFYKDKPPSRRVLTRVDTLLENYRNSFEINYYNIENTENSEFIGELGLPETHFPFAVAIDGKFTAIIADKTISFVHFPLFMKGIGRHEGNWSLEYLQMTLENNKLLSDVNILPIMDETNETSECE